MSNYKSTKEAQRKTRLLPGSHLTQIVADMRECNGLPTQNATRATEIEYERLFRVIDGELAAEAASLGSADRRNAYFHF